MISFRVSESEFEALRVRSESHGARSISDFARLALCGAGSTGGGRADAVVAQLSDEIQELRARVARVTELLERQPAPAAVAIPAAAESSASQGLGPPAAARKAGRSLTS
jgi:hypothetical protein